MIDYLGTNQEEHQRQNYKQKCFGIYITLQGTYYDKPIHGLTREPAQVLKTFCAQILSTSQKYTD
jgi:hypothetical protein